MIAAVYARKSTEQTNVDADATSVQRQIDNARAFARAKGWRVAAEHVYSDEAISGADARKLVNRQRLLDAAAADAPPFGVLIMRDASRFSRRDGDEAFGELKRLAQSGVEIWFYQEATCFTFGTFGDNVVGFVRAEMNAEYRRQIARFTKEAMIRKAHAGHVTGGSVFGYDNVRVDGHTERRINDAQATVIRRIFALCADGMGYTRIAKLLNAEGALAPTPGRKGRPAGWSPSTVHEVLRRPLYRGEVIYNQTRRRGPDGATMFARRPDSEWLRFDRPDLRIVPPDAWQAAHGRLDGIRAHLAQVTGGRHGARRHDSDSAYLLSGFARCGECGGSIGVLDRRQYGCIAYHKRGTTVCRNALKMPIATLNAAVVRTLGGDVLRPAAVKAVIDAVLAGLDSPAAARERARLQRDVTTLDTEIARLTEAIATGGQLTSLLQALTVRQTRRAAVAAELAATIAVDASRIDRRSIGPRVQRRCADWRAALAGDVAASRQLLREVLVGPLVLTPTARAYRFAGEAAVAGLLLGEIGLPTFVARPGGFAKGCTLKFSGIAA